jgi:hypothetical protein
LTAIAATLGLVLEPFLSVELLVASRENKIPTALFTGDVFVFQGTGLHEVAGLGIRP